MKDQRCPKSMSRLPIELFGRTRAFPDNACSRVHSRGIFSVGTWLSLVEHSLGVRGVGSSNLPVPTIKINSSFIPIAPARKPGIVP